MQIMPSSKDDGHFLLIQTLRFYNCEDVIFETKVTEHGNIHPTILLKCLTGFDKSKPCTFYNIFQLNL